MDEYRNVFYTFIYLDNIYYTLVYGEKAFGLDAFVATLVISIVMSATLSYFIEIKECKYLKNLF